MLCHKGRTDLWKISTLLFLFFLLNIICFFSGKVTDKQQQNKKGIVRLDKSWIKISILSHFFFLIRYETDQAHSGQFRKSVIDGYFKLSTFSRPCIQRVDYHRYQLQKHGSKWLNRQQSVQKGQRPLKKFFRAAGVHPDMLPAFPLWALLHSW